MWNQINMIYFNQINLLIIAVQLSIGANFNMVVTRASREVAALYECRETSDIKRGAWLIYISKIYSILTYSLD